MCAKISETNEAGEGILSTMILTVQHLEKYFGAQVCLKDISFQLDAQDRVGIIGENGAGKTTLIQCITGEYEPDSG